MTQIKHPVDDFFKEALQEHQVNPSDAGRQRFLKEAATLKINGKRSRLRRFLLFGGLIVSLTAATVLWFFDYSGQRIAESEQSAAISQQDSVESESPASLLSVPSSPDNTACKTIANESASDATLSPGTAFSTTMLTSTSAENNAAETSTVAIQPSDKDDPQTDSVFHAPSDLQKEDTLSKAETNFIADKIKKRKGPSEWQLATSVYYLPEWMFNTLEGNKFVSNLGVEESFRYGRYILRTGIGLSIAKGTNELMVEYNDYLGSFDQLDSISFHWDERNYHLIPTYYLSTKDVWDSLLRLEYPKVIKRYTYLQIPLILGYDVIQKNRFSLGFRAGPVLSILMNSEILSNGYDQGKHRIIRINQVTPDRIQTNWQIQGGLNLSFLISKRFGLELEPVIKYYFNSVYEKSEVTKKPWSVGFRASFAIHY